MSIDRGRWRRSRSVLPLPSDIDRQVRERRAAQPEADLEEARPEAHLVVCSDGAHAGRRCRGRPRHAPRAGRTAAAAMASSAAPSRMMPVRATFQDGQPSVDEGVLDDRHQQSPRRPAHPSSAPHRARAGDPARQSADLLEPPCPMRQQPDRRRRVPFLGAGALVIADAASDADPAEVQGAGHALDGSGVDDAVVRGRRACRR